MKEIGRGMTGTEIGIVTLVVEDEVANGNGEDTGMSQGRGQVGRVVHVEETEINEVRRLMPKSQHYADWELTFCRQERLPER